MQHTQKTPLLHRRSRSTVTKGAGQLGQPRQPLQLRLPGLKKSTESAAHGGDYTAGKRKTKRPFCAKTALHVVLRSTRARGLHSMLHPKHCQHIHRYTHALQRRWGVRVYRYANVGNHLHLLVRAKSRRDWQGFIRQLAGGIAMLVTGARKGNALKRRRRVKGTRPNAAATNVPPHSAPSSGSRAFWDHLVYTRIVTWGRDFDNVASYVCNNLWEGMGIPVRKILARGFRVLEMSEDGLLLVPVGASPEMLRALGHG